MGMLDTVRPFQRMAVPLGTAKMTSCFKGESVRMRRGMSPLAHRNVGTKALPFLRRGEQQFAGTAL